MRSSRTLIAIGTVVLLVVMVAAWGLPRWRQMVIARQDKQARQQMVELLAAGHAAAAVSLLGLQPRPFLHPDWSTLELRTLTAARDAYGLDSLYQRDPALFLRDEEASLLLQRIWLAGKHYSAQEQLRKAWRGHEQHPARWKLLDADVLLWSEKRDAAMALLKGDKFAGAEEEAARLVRLALLAGPQDAKAAWEYLAQARRTDPRNPETRSFCAQFLEAAGQSAAAHVEYAAAVLADPHNPLMHDQLAEFHRRQGNLDLAVQAWREALASAPAGYLWIKALFWARVVQPPAAAFPRPPAEGTVAPLIAAMLAIPDNKFWDVSASGQAITTSAGRTRPEIFWLDLLEQLRSGQEAAALMMIDKARLHELALQPDLARAIRQLLIFRRKAAGPAVNNTGNGRTTGSRRHVLFEELDNLERGSGMTVAQGQFFRGPNAFSAACFAAGWRGAGLKLWNGQPPSAETPEWYSYALVQSLRYNRSPAAALDFLAKIPSTPALEMLAGEFLIIQKRLDDGCARLAPFVQRNDPIGYRAAWLTAVTRLEQGKSDAARTILAQQPQLGLGVAGRELEARMELAAGRIAKAEALYRSVVEQSVEARVWLARRAALRKDWAEAKRLTLELIGLLPDEMALRQSLATIEQESRKQ